MLVRNTVVSTGVFVLGLVILWVLVEFAGVDSVVATAASFLIANTTHYALGRAWIFAGTERRIVAGYVVFLGSAVVGLVITVGLFWALTEWTSMHYILARIVVSVFAGLAIFTFNATVNFRQI